MNWLLVIIVFCFLSNPHLTVAQRINVSTEDGGSVVTEVGYSIKLNKNSTLHRTWFVFNDPSCPVELSGAGIEARYGDRELMYVPVGTAQASEPITALQIRYLLYDVFGEHMRTLSATVLANMPAKGSLPLKEIGCWDAWENDVSALLTVVTFVARVRTRTGEIWRYQDNAVSEELNRIHLKATTGVLNPSKGR